jgi:hypothetical protein
MKVVSISLSVLTNWLCNTATKYLRYLSKIAMLCKNNHFYWNLCFIFHVFIQKKVSLFTKTSILNNVFLHIINF